MMIRSILAIIAGYAIFAVSAVLLFSLSGINPHATVSTWFMVLAIVCGIIFAAIGGYLTAVIARGNGFLHSGILTIVIAGGALFSLLSSPSKEAVWSQLAALFLMAPSAMIGGYIWTRRKPNFQHT